MNKLLLILMLFAAGVAPAAYADFQTKGLAEADSAYNAGNYQEAISLYVMEMEMDGVSAPALFNLGNACLKAGEMGKAVLCYERAHRLDPSDKAIAGNLAYARSKVEDANRSELKGKNLSVSPDAPSFFLALYNNVTADTSSDFWAKLAAISFVLLLCAVALYIFSANIVVRKTGFFTGIFFLAFSVIFLVFSFAAASRSESREEGVITAYKVELLEEPGEKSRPSSTPLTRGTKLDILDDEVNSSGEVSWYKVRLNSDFVGWIAASDFEII